MKQQGQQGAAAAAKEEGTEEEEEADESLTRTRNDAREQDEARVRTCVGMGLDGCFLCPSMSSHHW